MQKLRLQDSELKSLICLSKMKKVIEDRFVKWETYTKAEMLCGRFSLEQWEQITGDIQSDIEWADFVDNYSDSVKCWVLKNKRTYLSIAFIYIFNEDGEWKIVSIHGGGWEKPLMYYRGYVIMLKYLLEQGLKVRTYCKLSNPTAIRFSQSVGFVPYRYSDKEVFMWISSKRLKSSKIYKYFYC